MQLVNNGTVYLYHFMSVKIFFFLHSLNLDFESIIYCLRSFYKAKEKKNRSNLEYTAI